MNKIVVVSLVANSEDIIESFVRYSLTFADEMLIVDHLSTDRTWAILRAMESEGLPISVMQFEEAELNHGELMSRLMWQAFQDLSADIVLPIDADEFLLTDCTEQSVRQILQRVRTDMVLAVHHWRYELKQPEKDVTTFLLSRPSFRKHQKDQAMKVIMGRMIVKDYPCLSQGAHYAYKGQDERGEGAPCLYIDTLFLAHYQWRSYEQAVAKTINGWISNAAKYSIHTAKCAYWKSQFDRLLRGEKLNLGLRVDEKEDCQPLPVMETTKLRYTGDLGIHPLQQLMRLSENLAQQYSECQILERQRYISILIPFFGDRFELKNTIENVLEIKYPYQDLVVIDFLNQREGVASIFEKYDCTATYVSGTQENYAATLHKIVKGDYIQWLFPGIRLDEDKLIKMLTSLETDYKLTFVLSNARRSSCKSSLIRRQPLEIQHGEEFFVVNCSYYGRQFLKSGRLLSGGISAILFRRQMMEDCHWLQQCIINCFFLQLTALLQIFSIRGDSQAGAFAVSLLVEMEERYSWETLCLRELEWLLQIQEKIDLLTVAEREDLKNNLLQDNVFMERNKEMKKIPIYLEYKHLFEKTITII